MGEANRRMDLGLAPKEAMPQQIMVDLTDAEKKICECGCEFYQPVIRVFKVSALLSPTGKESIAQQSVLICLKCHEVMK